MTERPIIFSAPMVRAILEGRKTQTRRLIGPQPKMSMNPPSVGELGWSMSDLRFACPYGYCGDRLWVRETFSLASREHHLRRDRLPRSDIPIDVLRAVGSPQRHAPESVGVVVGEPVGVGHHLPRRAHGRRTVKGSPNHQVSFRRGQLATGLESALAALQMAHRCIDLLPDGDRKLLDQAIDMIRAIEQRTWLVAAPRATGNSG